MAMSGHIRFCCACALAFASLCVGSDASGANIAGGKIHILPGETEDRAQSNAYVKVIRHRDGSAQVFYHDPESDRLVEKEIPAGQTLKISYWNNVGKRVSQEIKTAGYSGTKKPPAEVEDVSTRESSGGAAASSLPPLKPSVESAGGAAASSLPPLKSTKKTAGDSAAMEPPNKASSGTSPGSTDTPIASTAPGAGTMTPMPGAAASDTTSSTTSITPDNSQTSSAETEPFKPEAIAQVAVPLKAMTLPAVVPAIPSSQPATASPAAPLGAVGDTYISATNTALGPCIWKKSPIKVFIAIAPTANTVQLETEVKDAFETWTKVTNNKLKFEFCDARGADIMVTWVATASGLRTPNEAGQADVDYNTTGKDKKTVQDPGDITHADIKLLTQDINHHDWQPGQLRLVALHEIGHSLGVFGHSPKPGDIMYSQKGADELSSRDIDTVKTLYQSRQGE